MKPSSSYKPLNSVDCNYNNIKKKHNDGNKCNNAMKYL